MAQIILTIDDTKVHRVVNAMKGLYSIPEKSPGVPEFTDNAWAKESIRRLIKRDVARWETIEAQRTAKVPEDDSLIS